MRKKKIESSFSSVILLFPSSLYTVISLLSKIQNCIWNRMSSFHSTVGHWYSSWFWKTKSDTNPIYIQWIMRWGQKPHEYEIRDPNTLTELLLNKKGILCWLRVSLSLPTAWIANPWMNIHSTLTLAQNEMTQTHILPEYMLFCALFQQRPFNFSWISFRYCFCAVVEFTSFTSLVMMIQLINFTLSLSLHLFVPL